MEQARTESQQAGQAPGGDTESLAAWLVRRQQLRLLPLMRGTSPPAAQPPHCPCPDLPGSSATLGMRPNLLRTTNTTSATRASHLSSITTHVSPKLHFAWVLPSGPQGIMHAIPLPSTPLPLSLFAWLSLFNLQIST